MAETATKLPVKTENRAAVAMSLANGVAAEKIEAKGVLTVKLPKTAEAQKSEKKIQVRAA